MRVFNISLACILMLSMACQPDIDYLYEVNELDIMASNDHKSRQKTEDQYLATLYANLFQRSASGDQLAEMRSVLASIGDKELGITMLVGNLLSEPDVQIPEMAEMRADLDEFIRATYRRFLVREPSQAELTHFRVFLNKNPQLTPEMVYLSFILSKEYQFY